MIAFLAFMLPMIVQNTRLSFLGAAFMTVLLSINLLVQVELVLGDHAPFRIVQTAITPTTGTSLSKTSPSKPMAWIGPAKMSHRQRTEKPYKQAASLLRLRDRQKAQSRAESMIFQQSFDEEECPSSAVLFPGSRRNFFRAAAAGSLPVLAFLDSAMADGNSTSAEAVDWDAFGAQLKQSDFSAAPPPSTGGSDLDKVLKESGKKRVIDPRTHG